MPTRIGIIAEYNPFHEGHAYQIAEAKKRYPGSDIVVFMSGDFVQRGEPAIISKNFRAKAAIEGGGDIVLSPPVFASLSSAGDFAYYGVTGLLDAGCDAISFGAEDPDISLLADDIKKIILLEETSEYNDKIRTLVSKGKTYPAAREEAVKHFGVIGDDVFEKLKKPNNLLAFEYIRALIRLGHEKDVPVIPVKREGMGYHETGGSETLHVEFPSAEALRKQIHDLKDFGRDSISGSTLKRLVTYGEKYSFVFPDDLSEMLFYRLTMMSAEELACIRDCDEDIANRVKSCLPEFESLSQFTELVKTRGITYTRISRVFMNALLDIKTVPRNLPYMYVLGCAKEKRYILSDINRSSGLYENYGDTENREKQKKTEQPKEQKEPGNSQIRIIVTGKDVEDLTVNDRSETTARSLATDRLAHELFCRLSRKQGGDRLPEMFREYIFI